jgi:molecular chaperone HtpG
MAPAKFQRIDGGLDEAILGQENEGSTHIAEFVKGALEIEDLEVEAKSLSSSELPAFIMVDEETRRMRDTLALSSRDLPPGLMNKKTFVVNTSSLLIKAVAKHEDKEVAKEILLHLYQLAQLSQKELPPKELSGFIERSSKVLEKLLSVS